MYPAAASAGSCLVVAEECLIIIQVTFLWFNVQLCVPVSAQWVEPDDLGIPFRFFFQADIFQIGFKVRSAQYVIGMHIIQRPGYMIRAVVLYNTLDHL